MNDAQLITSDECRNRFHEAFSKIISAVPPSANQRVLKTSWIETKLGPMLAIADDEGLYLLEFIERRGLENEIKKLKKTLNVSIIFGETSITNNIATEIKNYFDGKIVEFKTPIHLTGTNFQKKVWQALQKIPSGETRSYLEVAQSLNMPTASRAVARANSTNQLAIVIPCHRVINSNGEMGGYAAGVARKQWLLKHEKN